MQAQRAQRHCYFEQSEKSFDFIPALIIKIPPLS